MTAKEIHQKILVLDSHCDTPIMLSRYGLDIGQRTGTGHVDLVRMKEGGVDASFFAIYVSNKWEPYQCTYKALEALASVYDMLDRYPDKAAYGQGIEKAGQDCHIPGYGERRSHSQGSFPAPPVL